MLLSNQTVEEVAHYLAEENIHNEPAIQKTYWFPASNEIRLVHVDSTAPPSSGTLQPFYFGSAPQDNIPFRSAVALIPPDQDDSKLSLPQEWGTWEDAITWEWTKH